MIGRLAEIAVVNEVQKALKLIGGDLNVTPVVGHKPERVLKVEAIAQRNLDRLIDRQVDRRKLDQEDADAGLSDRDGGKQCSEFLAEQVAKLLSRLLGSGGAELGQERRDIVLPLVNVFVDFGER